MKDTSGSSTGLEYTKIQTSKWEDNTNGNGLETRPVNKQVNLNPCTNF